MPATIEVGDYVFVKRHAFLAGRTAKVASVDSRTENGTKSCPCCGLGLSLIVGDPNKRYGASPLDVVKLDRKPV
jgi:hypothetical protein